MSGIFRAASTVFVLGGAAAAFAIASPTGEIGQVLEGGLTAGGFALLFVAFVIVAGTVREVAGL